MMGMFLDDGDVFGSCECFWMLGMFLDVGGVFGCWECFWMLRMFLDDGDVFGSWGCFWMMFLNFYRDFSINLLLDLEHLRCSDKKLGFYKKTKANMSFKIK